MFITIPISSLSLSLSLSLSCSQKYQVIFPGQGADQIGMDVDLDRRVIPALLLALCHVTFNEPWSCEIVTNRIEWGITQHHGMSIGSIGDVEMELVHIS